MIDYYTDTPDTDALEKLAGQMLTRPSDMGIWDDRVYSTHGAFIAWAERGDDILAESNYLTVLAHLQGMAEDPEDVIDGSFGHWAVGSLRQIFVRVYREPETALGRALFSHYNQADPESAHAWLMDILDKDGYGWDALQETESAVERVKGMLELGKIRDGQFYTDAFITAAQVHLALQDYPVWDESDYSDRESEAWEKSYAEAEADLYRLSDEEDENWELIVELQENTDLQAELRQVVDYGGSEGVWWEELRDRLPEANRNYLKMLAEENGQVEL